jgi:hypothetical protein
MDGPVEITEEHIDLLIKNHNEKISRLSTLADGHAFTRSMPPLQVDHSTSAMMTVGRVTGSLSKGIHTNEDGSVVPAMFASKILILGKENVEKVADGRWANVSIGADLETGILNELSITPFPAAPNATLLKDGKKLSNVHSKGYYKGYDYQVEEQDGKFICYIPNEYESGKKNSAKEAVDSMKKFVDEDDQLSAKKLSEKGEPMHEKLKKHLMEKHSLSEEDAEKKAEKMTKKLSEKEGNDEEKVKAHLEAMDDEKMSALAAECDEDDKKMADDVKEEDKKLSLRKAEIIKLSKGFNTTMKSARLAQKTLELRSKVSALRARAKISPAEQKKINFVKLASMSEESMNAVLKAYEDREPVVDSAQHGTTRAVNLAAFEKKTRLARLEAETKKDLGMPMEKKDEEALSNETPVAPAVPGSETTPHGSHDENMKSLHSMMEGYDQRDAVMAHVSKMMESYKLGSSTEGEEHSEKQMSAIAENMKQLQTQYQGLIMLVGESVGIEKSELTE